MTEFRDQDLSGATFDHVLLRGARIHDADLSGVEFRKVDLVGARFRNVDLCDTRLRGVLLGRVEIDGEIEDLTINGVDVGPLIEAELDRREPERAKMRPTDPEGFREAWTVLERLWDGTVARARTFRPEQLHESVDDEWSFIQTLRHLVYATDVWVNRVVLGDPLPFDALSLPFDEAEPHPDVPWDREARPSLDVVLALRADRWATVRRVLDELTPERLEGHTEPVDGPGWPPPDAYPVREALLTVLNEEWHHRKFAERDLSVLEQRAAG
ncbi:DinB family protein [Nocardioides sp. GXQ0305]|uniref:DinB family protein n=1 Tax=Nocardioides sp. GXQ0305 TaxID=3423912 RepID=UPI003D7D02D8